MALSGATPLRIPQPHNGLVSSGQGINEILNFLKPGTAATSADTTPFVEPKSALVIIGYPADVWLTDPTGSVRKDNESLLTIFNPKPGSYKIRFLPKGENARLIIAQFLKNGRVLWKEYPRSSKLPEVSTLHFNPDNPLEDSLK